jgi:hypothetical protein
VPAKSGAAARTNQHISEKSMLRERLLMKRIMVEFSCSRVISDNQFLTTTGNAADKLPPSENPRRELADMLADR